MIDWLQQVIELTGFDDVRLSEQLTDGLISSRWLLATNAGDMVVTVDHPLAAEMLLDREFQFSALESIYARGIGPEPVALDASAGLFVVRYLPGKTCSGAQIKQHNVLQQLAATLRKVHAADLSALPVSNSLLTRVRNYARLARSGLADQLLAEAEMLLEQWAQEDTAVLCHNDVNHGNVIVGEPLRLIDWDYAAIGSPWFDLAAVTEYHQLPAQAIRQLLAGYFGAGTPKDLARFEAWRRIYRLVCELWELCITSQSGSPEA